MTRNNHIFYRDFDSTSTTMLICSILELNTIFNQNLLKTWNFWTKNGHFGRFLNSKQMGPKFDKISPFGTPIFRPETIEKLPVLNYGNASLCSKGTVAVWQRAAPGDTVWQHSVPCGSVRHRVAACADGLISLWPRYLYT